MANLPKLYNTVLDGILMYLQTCNTVKLDILYIYNIYIYIIIYIYIYIINIIICIIIIIIYNYYID